MVTAAGTVSLVASDGFGEARLRVGTAEPSVQTGTDEAFDAVVEQFAPMAYNVALRILRNPADAEDAVQDAFVSAYRGFSRFHGQSKLSTWLYRIVVNAALMKIRKESRRAKYLSQAPVEEITVQDKSNDPERAAVNGELRRKLEQGIGSLPEDLRLAIILRDVQSFTNDEASETIGISVAALKSRLHRGRILLRQYLSEYLANEPTFVAQTA